MGVNCSCFSLRRAFGDALNAERLVNSFALLFFNIMKKLFLSLVATVIATLSFAQTSLLATLSHDGTISTFYGTTALKEALEKADNGDAITLSAGQFQAANITKGITLRGAGMSINNDSINSHESTIVQGEFDIDLTDSTTTSRLIVEGLYFTSQLSYKGKLRNALFMKSRFESVLNKTTEATLINSSFIHCRIASRIRLSKNSNACLINSVVWNPFNATYTGSNFEFDNCVVCFTTNYSDGPYAAGVTNSYYKNSVIMLDNSTGSAYKSYAIPYSCAALYCVGCTSWGETSSLYNDIFYNLSSKGSSNKNAPTLTDIFKSADMKYNDSHNYNLTETAKAKYLGTDGKEVGIHGGNLPYEEDPTTPQITKCNVAAKSTADGKLSVDIEVKAAEY